MNHPQEYAQLLRAIGQALEVLKFGSFEIEFVGEDFLVHGSAETSTEQEEARRIRERLLKVVWENIPGDTTSEEQIDLAMSTWPAKLHLRYTPKDMERLEESGKAKRRTDAGVPDIANLSQLLRTIGAYVEKKRVRLVKISRYGESLAIEYDHAGRERRTETVSAGSLYEFWVELYLQRSGRDEK